MVYPKHSSCSRCRAPPVERGVPVALAANNGLREITSARDFEYTCCSDDIVHHGGRKMRTLVVTAQAEEQKKLAFCSLQGTCGLEWAIGLQLCRKCRGVGRSSTQGTLRLWRRLKNAEQARVRWAGCAVGWTGCPSHLRSCASCDLSNATRRSSFAAFRP